MLRPMNNSSAFSAHDAAYVALAMALDAPLATADRKLASVADLSCVVEVR